MGGELGVNVGPDTTSISADVLSDRAADAVRLLADVVQRPRLPETELARVKGNLLRKLAIQRSYAAVARPGEVRRAALRRASVRPAVPDRGDARGLHDRPGAGVPQEQLRRRTGAALRRRRLRRRGDGGSDSQGVRGVGPAARRRTPPSSRCRRAGDSRCSIAPMRRSRRCLLGLRVPSPSHKDWVALEVTDCAARRLIRLAHHGEYPRAEGLHLFAIQQPCRRIPVRRTGSKRPTSRPR